ncbi:Uncharacterised protein [Flavonifractor plautii]|uniref:Uncharacterized protein n=1 Tax=Flavonifractor plautii TaxID=292800 RepID=A0A174D1G0_FLAPL|nr:Uncharacterised protein [Flavonifractor plautii]
MITVASLTGGHQAVAGVGDAVEGLLALLLVGQAGNQSLKVVQSRGTGCDVGGTALHGLHRGLAPGAAVQRHGAHYDIRLGGIVGHPEAHVLGVGHHIVVGGAVVMDVVIVDEAVSVGKPLGIVAGSHLVVAEGGVAAGQIQGGGGDSAGSGHLLGQGNHQRILLLHGGQIGGAHDKVALIGALGYHAHRLARGQQRIDGTDGFGAVVGQQGDRAGAGALAGGLNLRDRLQSPLKGPNGVDGGAVKAAHVGETGYRLGVQAGETGGGGVIALVQDTVGVVALGLIHIHDQGAGLVGHAVHRSVPGQAGNLDAVADQELCHGIGVGGVTLGGRVHGEHIVLGKVFAIARIRHPPGILRQGLVAHVHVPLLHLVAVILVVHGAAEELQLRLIAGILTVGQELPQAIHAALQ